MTKTSHGETPFYLVYGQEAIMPAELEILTYRLAFQTEELDVDPITLRFNAILALEEQRKTAHGHAKKRKKIIKRSHDKKAKAHEFRVGQRVLLWDSAHEDRGKHTKFQHLWLGPFTIAQVLGNNAFRLKDSQEHLFSHSVNGSVLKPYYCAGPS